MSKVVLMMRVNDKHQHQQHHRHHNHIHTYEHTIEILIPAPVGEIEDAIMCAPVPKANEPLG